MSISDQKILTVEDELETGCTGLIAGMGKVISEDKLFDKSYLQFPGYTLTIKMKIE